MSNSYLPPGFIPVAPVGPPGRGLFPGLLQPYDWLPDNSQADNPFRRDQAVKAMSGPWGIMDSVSSGTELLRAWAAVFLPKEQREDDDAWWQRVSRSVLSPYTTRLIENAAGAVLRRPVLVEGTSFWERFSQNVDGMGSSVNEFARRLLVSALIKGHSAILVDFPANTGAASLLEERISAARPYFNHIAAERIFGWRQDGTLPSSPLSQVRIYERVRVDVGEYGEDLYDQMRVIENGRYKTLRAKSPQSSFPTAEPMPAQFDDSGWQQFSLPIIPIVPVYTNRQGMLRSSPLLIDIAYLNVAHYQRQADLLHALHIAAMPILVLEGWDDSSSTSVGVNYALRMDPGNKAYYVQSDASSFQSQANMLLMLEQQMSTLGVTKLLGQKFVAESADAKRIDQSQANSVLSIISMELENSLQQAFNMAAAYMNITPPKVSIERDFDYYRLIGQDLSVLGKLVQDKLLTVDTYLKVLRTGEVLPDSVDLLKETAAVQALQTTAAAQQVASMNGSQTNTPPAVPAG